MSFLSKKQLARRTILRGLGAAVSLPVLDAMIPAMAPQAFANDLKKHRHAFIYLAHGAPPATWVPPTLGKNFEFSQALKPAERFRDYLTVVSGMDHPAADAPAPHALSQPVWLTGAHPKATDGKDVRAAKTIDQIIADHLGQDTQFPSIEMGTEDMTGLIGTCDAGYSCTYMNTISWRDATTPLPMELNPRTVFEYMLGRESTPEARARRLAADKSILDEIMGDVNQLQLTLGAADRNRMDSYLENIREVERRLQIAESRDQLETVPEAPIGIPATFEEHTQMMFDLIALAWEADLTRVASFLMVREVSERTYPHIGIPDPHHSLSHHQNNQENLDKLAILNAHHVMLFTHFLEKLHNTQDVDGSLLDNSTILYGSSMGNSNLHDHVNIPALLAGHGAGTLEGNLHVSHKGETMSNLLVTILNKAGISMETVGDSTGYVADV